MVTDVLTLPEKWEDLRVIPEQHAYRVSPHRFNTLHPGRRSGKTLFFKEKLIRRALRANTPWPDPRFFAAAPTRDQARRIYWDDLKAMVPRSLMAKRPSESHLVIYLINGAEIWVLGMDRPERIEGVPWDGGGLDEYGNMHKEAWPEHVRPALADRGGWCDFLGVPEGRNHYYDLDRRALAMQAERGPDSQWGSFHWRSELVLSEQECADAREDLDEEVYEQEFGGLFIAFSGRIYYSFDGEKANVAPLPYNPQGTLIFCFDFNVEPGVAVIAQEMKLPNGEMGTGVIGEVFIPRGSNTPMVCRKLIADWGKHEGMVRCYGDATGGARGTAQTRGNDWDLIKDELRPIFGGREAFAVPSSNPAERARINAVNSRTKSASGTVRLMVDPVAAPHVVRDLEGVRAVAGGSGEIDKSKKRDKDLSHISDALGYYVQYEFPVVKPTIETRKLLGV
jgi:hypothetical protein